MHSVAVGSIDAGDVHEDLAPVDQGH